jgi:hypothetical protein
MTDREERVSRNEVLFREVNERIEEIQTGEGVARRFDFLCECGDKNCVEAVNLTLAEYEDIRSEPTHFVVLPGHEVSQFERTVQTGDRFSVVRKLDEAGEFAQQHDPRS